MELKQKYTVSEATELLGFSSRSTINKRTNGKAEPSLSYEIDEAGNKVISVIELERVFPEKFKAAMKRISDTTEIQYSEDRNRQSNTEKNTGDTLRIRELELKLEAAHQAIALHVERIQEKDASIEDYRTRLTRAEETIHRQTLLLEHRITETKPPEMPVERPRGFWASILGKKS